MRKRYFTGGEEETIDRLARNGIDRTVAEILIFLARYPEATLPAIQRGTGIRLPAISISLRHLDELGLVESRTDILSGRKSKFFRLTKPIPAIIELFEKEREMEEDKERDGKVLQYLHPEIPDAEER